MCWQKYDKTVVIDYSIPNVRITGYKSIDWSDPEYLSHYYVFREPEPHEIYNKWKYNRDTLSPNIKALMYLNGDILPEQGISGAWHKKKEDSYSWIQRLIMYTMMRILSTATEDS